MDVHGCPNITASALCQTVMNFPRLIDVNATGIADSGGSSLPTLLRELARVGDVIPTGLRFVNQRTFFVSREKQGPTTQSCLPAGCGAFVGCCSVRKHSQRLSPSVPMSTMVHCIDCGLIPELDRGICQTCASMCHKGHRTFVGSWTRFYCDCPFLPPTRLQSEPHQYCRAIFPEIADTS